MPSYDYTDPQGKSFTLDVDEELAPQQVYQRFVDAGIAPKTQSQRETPGYLSQLGSALGLGYRQMKSGLGATFNAATGDVQDTAAAMAEMGALQREQEANLTPEDVALNEAFARNEAEYNASQGLFDSTKALSGYVGSTLAHPGAAFKQVVQSAPNALVGGATELGGYALGGLVGAGAGIETGPGAIATAIAGAMAGGAASNTLLEAGPAIFDILNERTNGAASSMTADQIAQVLQKNPDIMSEGLKTGAIRGSVIGAIEGLGMKGAGSLLTIPERAAARAMQKTLVDAGVDVASKQAVDKALLDPALRTAATTAAETAKKQFTSAGNLARFAGGAAIETGSAGAGELGAQVATGQQVSPTGVFQEMLGEAGMSLPLAGATKVWEARKYLVPQATQNQLESSVEGVINNADVAPLTAQVLANESPDATPAGSPVSGDTETEEIPGIGAINRADIAGIPPAEPPVANEPASSENLVGDAGEVIPTTEEFSLVAPEDETFAAQRRADLLAGAADAASGKVKTPVSPVVTAMVTPQPQTTQTNATNQRNQPEIVRKEPENGTQGREAAEAGARNRVQREATGAEVQKEVITPQGKPTTATVGKVMPRGSAVERVEVIPEDYARAKANAKKGGPEWERVKANTQPIEAYRKPDGQLKMYGGHHRLVNAQQEGKKTIPVSIDGEGVVDVPLSAFQIEQVQEKGLLHGTTGKVTEKITKHAEKLADTLQEGDVVETSDGTDTARYKVVIEDNTRSLRQIDQNDDVMKLKGRKYLANPVRQGQFGQLKSNPNSKDALQIIARGRVIRAGTEVKPKREVGETDSSGAPKLNPNAPDLEKQLISRARHMALGMTWDAQKGQNGDWTHPSGKNALELSEVNQPSSDQVNAIFNKLVNEYGRPDLEREVSQTTAAEKKPSGISPPAIIPKVEGGFSKEPLATEERKQAVIGYAKALLGQFPSLSDVEIISPNSQDELIRTVENIHGKRDEDVRNGIYEGEWLPEKRIIIIPADARLSTIAHEVGHAVLDEYWENADEATKKAIQAEHAAWAKKSYGKPTVADSLRSWQLWDQERFPDLGAIRKHPKGLSAAVRKSTEDYRTSFLEWAADQFSYWSQTKEQPKSLVDKFFADLSAQLAKIWDAVKQHFAPNATYANWIESLLKPTTAAEKQTPDLYVYGANEQPQANQPAPTQKPEQPASQKLIEMAERFGGRIAWADGDMGIVEAFQLFGSDSLYVAVVGNRYSTSDFTFLTPSNRKELLGENEELFARKREELIRENEKRLAENPDGPFTEGRTLVVSKGVPEKVASVFKEWAKMLGLNAPTRIVLTTFKDGIEMAAGYGGKFRRIGATATKKEGESGVAVPLGDNDFHIAYQEDVSFARILEVIAHELGHVLERQAFDKLPQDQRQAIMLEHEAWLKRVGPQKAIDGIKELRAMRTGKVHPGTDIERFDELNYYWKSFSEWFADQVARWSTTTAKPLSVVEKFFARLGKKLREFFFSNKHKFAPNQKVADWLNSLSPDFQTAAIDSAPQAAESPTSEKVKAGNAALDAILAQIPELERSKWTPAIRAQASKFFESGNSADLEGLTRSQKININEARYQSNPQAAAEERIERKLQEKRLREQEQENARLEKERERQAKLTESRRNSLDSIIGKPQEVEMDAVSVGDGRESLAMVHNSGDVPGVLNAFVGTSKDFLANPENEKNFPGLYRLLKAGRVDEGNFAYGRAFVFTDGIGINAADRANAAKLGVTPAIAAVRRVLIHESLVHRGIFGLPAHLQRKILQWVQQNTTPEQLDVLAKTYPQYADWRSNENQLLALCEEFLAKKVEKLTTIPKSGPLARLMDILSDIWRWITGNTGEPTIKNLKDVVKLLKAGAEAADARLVNGGKIQINSHRLAFKTKNGRTIIELNGKPVSGPTRDNLTDFPSNKNTPVDTDAYFSSRESFDQRAASDVSGQPVAKTRRIERVTVPDKFKGIGLGKALVLAHLQQFPNTTFYNSQASPELTRALQSLNRDELIELKGDLAPNGKGLTNHTVVLTEKGSGTNPLSLVNGGKIKMSQLRAQGFVTPEMDKAYMDAVNAGDMEKAQWLAYESYQASQSEMTAKNYLAIIDRKREYENLVDNLEQAYNRALKGDDTKEQDVGSYFGPQLVGKDELHQSLSAIAKTPEEIVELLWRQYASGVRPMPTTRDYLAYMQNVGIIPSKMDNAWDFINSDEADNIKNRVAVEAQKWLNLSREGKVPTINPKTDPVYQQVINDWLARNPKSAQTLRDLVGSKGELIKLDARGMPMAGAGRFDHKGVLAVTYDDAGNVIPLSQRFNAATPDIRASYIGEGAIKNFPEERRQFMRDSLDAAKAMASSGKSSEEIRAVTGWSPGKYDGKMRWEVPDEGAEIIRNGVDLLNKGKEISLNLILSHEDLFTAYQDLSKVRVSLGSNNSFDESTNTITLSRPNLSTLLHEVQHSIQSIEGFARGGTGGLSAWFSKKLRPALLKEAKTIFNNGVEPPYIDWLGSGEDTPSARSEYAAFVKNWKSKEFQAKLWDAAQKGAPRAVYEKLAGEIEARDVQARQKLTPEQRAATAPYSSENIAPEDAIVIFGNQGVQESRPTYANPIDAQLANAAERMRAMREREAAPPVPKALSRLFDTNAQPTGTANKLFQAEESQAEEEVTPLDNIKRIVSESVSRSEVESLLKDLNTEEIKEVVRSIGYPTQGTKADNIRRILSFVGSRADAIAIRGINPINLNAPTIVRTPEQQAAFDEELRLAKERANELDISLPQKKPLYDQEKWNRNMAAIMAPSSVAPQKIRNEIRAAYDRAIVGESSIQVPIQKVFDEAKGAIPSLTERDFGKQLQNLYEDGSAFLVPTDRSADMIAAGEKWGVYDAAGMPASYVGIMPAQESPIIYATPIDRNAIQAQIEESAKAPVNEDSLKGFLLRAIAMHGQPSSVRMARLDPDAPLQVSAQPNGELVIGLGVRQAGEVIRNSRSTQAGFKYLADAVEEEMIHFADLLAMRSKWEAQGKQTDFDHFIRRQSMDLTMDLMQTAETLSIADKEALRKALASNLASYSNNPNWNNDTLENVIQAYAESPMKMNAELVRSLIQAKRSGEITATGYQRIANTIVKWLQDALDWLKRAYNQARGGSFGNVLAQRIQDTEEQLEMLGAPVEIKASRISNDVDTAIHSTRGMKGKVDNIIKELPANSFTGKPLQDAVSQSFAPLGSDQFYADIKPIVIKSLDDMVKRGVDDGNLLETILDPRFAIDNFKGWNPAATAVVSNIFFAEALNRAVKKQDQLLADGDIVGYNLQQQKIDAWSKYNFSDRNEWGVIGNAIQKVMNDPEYQGLYLLSNFRSQKIKQEQEVTDSSMKDPVKAAEEIDKAGKDSKDDADEAVSDAAEELSLEDLIRDGEASLSDAEKSLWQRAKEYMIHLGAIAKAEIQAAFTGKASNAISASDLVKHYIAMPKDKRDKEKARFKKELNDVLGKLIGDKTTAKGKKKGDLVEAFEKKRSRESIKDKVFGPDEQKAFKALIRKLNAARPGETTPLARVSSWKALFEMTPTDQGMMKGRMFDTIKNDPAFDNLTPEEQQKLATLLEKAWDKRREQFLTRELDRIIRTQNMSKKAAKALEQRPAILRKIDSGVFDYENLAALVGEQYGIKNLTPQEAKRVKEISSELGQDLMPHERTKLQDELQELMVSKNLSLGEMLKAWWITAVLTGPRTAFTIGLSFMTGGFELVGHSMSVLANPKMSMQEKSAAIGDAIKNWWGSIGREAKAAWMFVLTGDKTIQDPSALMSPQFFDKQFRGNMGRFSFSAAEKMIKSTNPVIRALGWFMTYGGRILSALDSFNYGITKAGSAPLVYSMLKNAYKPGQMSTSKLVREAKNEIIQKGFDGEVPNASTLNAWARNLAYAKLETITGLAENMNQVAKQGNFTLEPTGFGGLIYNALKHTDAFVQRWAEERVNRMRKDMLKGDNYWIEQRLFNVAEFVQAGLMQVLPILGLQFAKFATNSLNQTISFIPIAGLGRLKEQVDGQAVHNKMIWRNQAIGSAAFMWIYISLKAIEQEPDDEKRGWGIEGDWSNLTPQQKRQRDATGLKENTIWWRNKDGKRVVLNYVNWPVRPLLAAFGSMSDQIKYAPDQWQKGGVMKRGVTTGWAMAKSVLNTSAVSQFTELFGSNIASRDPVEAFTNKAARVFGGYAGGFVPRFIKDIDRWMQPEINKYEGWEYLGKELPFYRRSIGHEYLDVFGKVIAPSQAAWSREMVQQPMEPEYRMLGRLNSRGLWLTPAVAENRLVGKGLHKRPMTDEEAQRYVKAVGQGYREMILRYGDRLLSMPKDRAKDFLAAKSDDVRDRSVKLATRPQ